MTPSICKEMRPSLFHALSIVETSYNLFFVFLFSLFQGYKEDMVQSSCHIRLNSRALYLDIGYPCSQKARF